MTLFDSLFKTLINSFSTDAKECFSQFETKVAPFLSSEEKIDEVFESTFIDFPESNFNYQKIIEALISFASTDPVSILSNVCDSFLKELNRTDDQASEMIIMHMNSSCVSNFYFYHFVHHLNLKILTDLIKIFFIRFPSKQLIQKVVTCGYKLCASSISDYTNNLNDNFLNPLHSIFSKDLKNEENIFSSRKSNYFRDKNYSNSRLSKLKHQLIQSWSIIFYHISKVSMNVISFSLEQYSDYVSSGHIFTLVSKVYADPPFIELLLYTLQNCQKHNQITAEMLTSLTSLFLIVKDISEKVLINFFTVIWSLKNHPKLKDEAIELICVLFNRLPNLQTKAIQFYNSKVYIHADDDRKVKRSAKAFLYQIRGDVSKLAIEGENPQFFNSSGNPPNDSFAVIFIKTFFERSNFSVCIHLFGQILAHLASIDIDTFERIIVPNFAKLDVLSPKFASMAVALNIMNSDTFIKENFCKSTESKINEINSYFKAQIVDSFPQLIPCADDKYMILTRKVQKRFSKIDNSDQFIIEFISNNSLYNFSQTSKKPKSEFIDDSANKNISLQESENERTNNENQSSNQAEAETDTKNGPKKKSKSKLFSHKKSNKFRIFNRKNKSKEPEKTDSNSTSIDEEQKPVETEKTVQPDKDSNSFINFSLIADLIRCIPYITDLDVLKSTDIVTIIVRLMCHYDKDVSAAANEAYSNFLKIEGSLDVILEKILGHLMCFSDEVASQCLYILYKMIKALTYFNSNDEELNGDIEYHSNKKKKIQGLKNKDDFYRSLEMHVFCSLVYDSSYCRTIAFDILKRLSLMKVGFLYKFMQEKSSLLTKMFNKSILLAKNPFSSNKLANPIIGQITIENACCCQYNDLWLFYLSNIVSALMDSEPDLSAFIIKCGEIVHDVFFAQITNFTRISASIIYINSLCYEKSIAVKSKDDKMINMSSFLEFDSELNIKDSQKIKTTDFGSILGLLNSNDTEKKKKLIRICSLLNWRIIKRILPELLTVENELYSDVAESFVFIIKNSENFDAIITSIFPLLIKFLKLLQNYFQYIGINSTREILWDEAHINLLKKHHNLCINYCILTSLTFVNNTESKATENIMPLIYRQVQLKFLFHWSQLPTAEFEKLKTFSISTLISIINSGPVFIEGSMFDSNFFDLVVECELNGSQILYPLLNNQIGILLTEFIKNFILRNKEESRLFLKPILNIIENCKDSAVIENHVGSIILLSILLKKEKDKAFTLILNKIESLFISFVGFNSDSNLPNEKKKSKFERLNILKHFEFASEQMIESGLNILRECKEDINLFKSLIESIYPLFNNIHLLPNKRIIIQGVPSKFQIFTTVTFFNLMFNISENLNDDELEQFSVLWYELLRSSDNNSIVLLLLFEYANSDVKKKIFLSLLSKDPAMICDFLAERCTFAYWYFLRTSKKEDVGSILWIVPVLTRSFNYYFGHSSRNFIVCLHFSFLFIENCKDLFEVFLAAFRFESVDCDYVWTSEGPSQIIQAAYIINEIVSILNEQNSSGVVNWAEEATRWVIGCNDIDVGFRSLYILKVLQTDLPQNLLPLFAKAVSFHLLSISDGYDDQSKENEKKVSRFVAECFVIFYRQMNNYDLPTFAFRFASLFLNCKFLDPSCLKNAMPIFIACSKHMVLMSTAKRVLVEAFLPFLSDLESNEESQQIFAQIAELDSSPELFIVAAAFLRKSLPFVSILTREQIKEIEGRIKQSDSQTDERGENHGQIQNQNQVRVQSETVANDDADDDDDSESESSGCAEDAYDNERVAGLILSMPIKLSRIRKSLMIFGRLLYTSSFLLTDSILDVCSILLRKHEDDIDANVLVPIFLFAIKNIASMEGARGFVNVVLRVNPGIIHIIADRYYLNFTMIKSNVENSDDDDDGAVNEGFGTEGNELDASDDYEYEDGSDVYFGERKKVKKSRMARPASVNLINLNLNINMNSNRFFAMNEGTIENRKKMIEIIRKDLNEIDDNPIEIVPLTNCKQLSNLNGMIDQLKPPKISPFAHQLEMVSTVMKESSKQIKRTLSHGGILFKLNASKLENDQGLIDGNNSILFSSPSTPVLPSIKQNNDDLSLIESEKNFKVDLIPPNRPIIKEFVNLDEVNLSDIDQYVIDANEFLQLRE